MYYYILYRALQIIIQYEPPKCTFPKLILYFLGENYVALFYIVKLNHILKK